MTTRTLTADRLSCRRGGRIVFRDLSFTLAGGHVLALEGANGAGKTSLLRLVAGFLAPAAGSVELHDGEMLAREGEERAQHVGWLGHLDAAKPQMSVGETLRFWSALNGMSVDRDTIAASLEVTGLARLDDLSCQYLSAGQKKRLALARLKLSGRALWLMDEPLAALDAAGKAMAAGLITAHCAAGGLAVVATHEPLGIACERLVLGQAA